MTSHTDELRSALEKIEDKHDKALGEVIDQRDQFEEGLSQAYFLVTGRSPEWSNKWGIAECLEEIDDAQTVLRQALTKQPSQGVETDELRDVFERAFDGDDPRLKVAQVITRAEANAILEHAGDMIAALCRPAQGVEQGWLDISSAPRTGERVWGFVPGGQDRQQRIIWWKYFDADDIEAWQDDADSEPEPTHWRPLLDSPGSAVPDFLKRMTGELPPAPMPKWGDDEGREGRREGAEEDPQPPAPADMRRIVELLGFEPDNHHNAAKCPYCTPRQFAKNANCSGDGEVLGRLESALDEEEGFGHLTLVDRDDLRHALAALNPEGSRG